MRGIVYVDILVLVNGVIGAFLLRCAARLCGCRAEGWRFLLGSAAAGLSSLILLLPPLPDAVLWLLKLGSAALIVLAGLCYLVFRPSAEKKIQRAGAADARA